MRPLPGPIAATLLLAAALSAQGPVPTFPAPLEHQKPRPEEPTEVPVFWLLGQSNAVGPVSGYWLSNPFYAGGRYHHLHHQLDLWIWWPGPSTLRPGAQRAWETYKTGFFHAVNNATHKIAETNAGPEAAFGGAATEWFDAPVHLFKFARVIALNPDAPTTFSKRSDRETAYDEMFAEWQIAAHRMRERNLIPKVRGVLWVHGEADLPAAYAASYGRHLARFVTDLRADLLRLAPDNGPVRFVISELHDRHVPASGFDRGEAAIRAAQLHVVRTVPDCRLVNVDDLSLDPTSSFHVHFDAIGTMTLGERLFAAWSDGDRGD